MYVIVRSRILISTTTPRPAISTESPVTTGIHRSTVSDTPDKTTSTTTSGTTTTHTTTTGIILTLGKKLNNDGTALPMLLARCDKALEVNKLTGYPIINTGVALKNSLLLRVKHDLPSSFFLLAYRIGVAISSGTAYVYFYYQ